MDCIITVVRIFEYVNWVFLRSFNKYNIFTNREIRFVLITILPHPHGNCQPYEFGMKELVNYTKNVGGNIMYCRCKNKRGVFLSANVFRIVKNLFFILCLYYIIICFSFSCHAAVTRTTMAAADCERLIGAYATYNAAFLPYVKVEYENTHVGRYLKQTR